MMALSPLPLHSAAKKDEDMDCEAGECPSASASASAAPSASAPSASALNYRKPLFATTIEASPSSSTGTTATTTTSHATGNSSSASAMSSAMNSAIGSTMNAANATKIKSDTHAAAAADGQPETETEAQLPTTATTAATTTATTTQDDSEDKEKEPTRWYHGLVLSGFIILLGVAASGAFLAVGINSANQEQTELFRRVASEYIRQLENDWTDYETAGLWTHQATRQSTLTLHRERLDFTELYENLRADGLEFQAIAWLPNVSHAKRDDYQQEATNYYANSNFTYPGFQGYHLPSWTNSSLSSKASVFEPRSNQSFYFPVTYVEPLQGNENIVGVDMYSSPQMATAIDKALQSYLPTASKRWSLGDVLDQPDSSSLSSSSTTSSSSPMGYGIFLLHTGIRITALPDMKSRDLSLMEIRIPDLLTRTTREFQTNLAVYLYDTTKGIPEGQQFLGAVQVERRRKTEPRNLTNALQFLNDVPLTTLLARQGSSKLYLDEMVVADRTWTVVILASHDSYKPNHAFVILGGALLLFACLFVAYWEFRNKRRGAKYNALLRSQAQSERQALIVESSYRKRERDLNDYMAHEVRNPLAAAMTANSFVKEAIFTGQLVNDSPEELETLKDDVTVVNNSLHFMYDLLRNMLDMHRASSNNLRLDTSPTDLLKDVLEPVHSMLHNSNNKDVQVILECPEDLIVVSDRLRLKQIMLNLGRNSVKFVERGFVRLKAQSVVVKSDDVEAGHCTNRTTVQLSVEDSGTGVPLSKREGLFDKYQSSLDSLSQGTGIGLHLCKELVDLMGGNLFLDESFDSGLTGRPGARFVVDLNTNVMEHTEIDSDNEDEDGAACTKTKENPLSLPPVQSTLASPSRVAYPELPQHLSVLFVDDDFVLRKLFSRSLRKALPGWKVQECANGETALSLTSPTTSSDHPPHFDIIFMDQYMASVERQLLGTETVRALRAQGVKSRICGLSANDLKSTFLDCGANAFLMKPFPCEVEPLRATLQRVLFQDPDQPMGPSSPSATHE